MLLLTYSYSEKSEGFRLFSHILDIFFLNYFVKNQQTIIALHFFARDVLVMKKLEIEKTKPTFIILVLKVEYSRTFWLP